MTTHYTRLLDSIAGLATLVLIASFWLTAIASPAQPAAPKEFEITARRFAFEPQMIEVAEGDTVRLTVRSADGTHGLEIKKLKIQKEVPKGGAPVTVEFIAGKPGTYEINCSEYCGKGHKTMKGVLVVTPRDAGALPRDTKTGSRD
jgi:heme/copper-type cytochrome/quinol oxidase subunit 2